jgi:hypothetical protein
MSHPLRWPAVILLSSLVLSDLVLADIDGPARVAATFWFVLFCPGMAYAPLMGLPSAVQELLLALGLSLALGTIVATAIVVAGGLSVTTGLFALQAVCLVGCALQVRRWAKARRAPVLLDPLDTAL